MQLETIARTIQLILAPVVMVSACAIFIADMFVIALGAFNYAEWIGVVVLALFLCGTASLFTGVVLTGTEVRISHHAVHYEVQRVMGLK